ncbi:hypothetical protein P9112_012275 [Eukaryota sp. TZLM1-RC]
MGKSKPSSHKKDNSIKIQQSKSHKNKKNKPKQCSSMATDTALLDIALQAAKNVTTIESEKLQAEQLKEKALADRKELASERRRLRKSKKENLRHVATQLVSNS